MKRMLLAIKRPLDKLGDKLGNWYNSRGIFVGLFALAVAIFGLLLVVDLLASPVGLMMLYIPWLCTFIILTCLAVPFGVIVLTVFMLLTEALTSTQFPKRISENLWITGFILSVFLIFFSVFLGFWGTRGPIGIHGIVRARFASSKTEYPLAACKGIAVDSEGRIYLALQGYERIQVYSSEGNFLRGWFVEADGGVFDIWIEDKDQIHVVTARTDRHDVFDSSGRLLKNTEITSSEEYRRLSNKAGGLKEQDAFGNTYLIKSPTLYPRVVKVMPSGQQNVLIKNPFYFLLVRFPGPLVYVGLAALVMCWILGTIVRKKVDFSQLVTDSDRA